MNTLQWYRSLTPGAQRYIKELMLHEAQTQGPWGMAAIPPVVKQRVEATGRSVEDIINQPKQFSGFRLGGQPWTEEQLAAAENAIGIHDRTAGKTHYYNPDLANPDWAPYMTNKVRIGQHVFGDLGNRARDPYLGQTTTVAKASPQQLPSNLTPPRQVKTVKITPPGILADQPPPVQQASASAPTLLDIPPPPVPQPAAAPAPFKAATMASPYKLGPSEPEAPSQGAGILGAPSGVPGISILRPAPTTPAAAAAAPAASVAASQPFLGGLFSGGGPSTFPVDVNSLIGGGPPAGGYGVIDTGGFNFIDAIANFFGG